MVPVMVSSGSNSESEPDRRSPEVEPKDMSEEQKVPGVDHKLSLSSNSYTSKDSEGKEVPRVSIHVENASRVSDVDGDGSSVDLVSTDEDRISIVANGFKVSEIKNEDDSSKNGRLSGEKAVYGVVPTGDSHKKKHRKKETASNVDYDSMLSMFDEYAANGKSQRIGHGYEVGDMVWGKVKSHPWWPGHIFNEAFATASVRKTRRDGHVLVAFFGDSSYGWFDPAELIPFELNFAEKSRQTNLKTFVKAVEDAVDELNRRRGLGLACRCRNPYSFRPTDVKGYLAVDLSNSEAGVFSASQIRRARDSFVPKGMLSFLKELALKPMDNEYGNIHFIQNKATALALRKAVYEEFDETYAQAFGAQPERPAPATAPLEPSRAPLSGRLVFAEALGKGKKSSGQPTKSKDQSEKDQYLFKRRDEPVDAITPKICHAQSSTSSLPSEMDGLDLQVKGLHPGVVHPASHVMLPNVGEVSELSWNQPDAADQFDANETVHDNLSEKHYSGISEKKPNGETVKVKKDGEYKKTKVRKRPIGDMDSESSLKVEKSKKIKKDLVKETKIGRTDFPGAAGSSVTLMGKVQEDLQVNHQGSDVAKYSSQPDSLEGIPVKDLQRDLPQLLDDLRALALNPLHGTERNCLATVWQVFMNFRSLVFVKSPSNEPKDSRLNMSPSLASSSDNDIPGKPKGMQSVKPPKPPASLEDPTRGGKKRNPSDRLEEMTVKKKKKINDLKMLAAEKRAALKIPEAIKVDGKDAAGKVKASQKSSDIPRADGKEVARKSIAPTPARVSGSEPMKKKELPAKATNPVMLVMKFPAESSLPSSSELKAKFARFGPMDYKATRIFYTSYTCRVVYHRRNDAQAALNFAKGNFANMNVRCYIREKEVETTDAESAKATEDPRIGTPQLRDLAVPESRLGSNTASQPLQQNAQLKSCLKKPSSEDGIIAPAGGNGSVRGRVKFVLGGEGSGRTNADDAASSHGSNFNTDKSQMVVPPSLSTKLPVSSQLPFAPNNLPQNEIPPRNLQNTGNYPVAARGPPIIDIREQMIGLLCRCEGILKNLEGAFGHLPYHL